MWRAIDVRYSAVLQNGEWKNLFTRASFSWDPRPPATQGLLVLRSSFRAGRLWFPMPEGMDWLRATGSDRALFDGTPVHLGHIPGPDPDGPPRSVTNYGWTELQIDRTGGLSNLKQVNTPSLRGYVLMGNGGAAFELVNHEDWTALRNALLQLPQPYGGLEEFSTSYLGFSEPRGFNHPVAFEVEARFDTTILGWSIREGKTLVPRPPAECGS